MTGNMSVAGPGLGLAAGLFIEVVAMRQLAPNHAGDDTLLHGRLERRMGRDENRSDRFVCRLVSQVRRNCLLTNHCQ